MSGAAGCSSFIPCPRPCAWHAFLSAYERPTPESRDREIGVLSPEGVPPRPCRGPHSLLHHCAGRVPPRVPRGLYALFPADFAGGAVLSDPGGNVRHCPPALPSRPGPRHRGGKFDL